jgi:hypothetical protein
MSVKRQKLPLAGLKLQLPLYSQKQTQLEVVTGPKRANRGSEIYSITSSA